MTVAAAAAPWASEEASEEANAAPWASEEASEEGNGKLRQLFWRRRQRLVATVKGNTGQGDFVARVKAQKTFGGGVRWTVNIKKDGQLSAKPDDASPEEDCTSYNWHIHAKPIPQGGGCGDTGGHTDNSLMCGGATDRAEDCNELYDCPLADRTPVNKKCYSASYGQRCGKAKREALAASAVPGWFQKGCEYGDLSGKMGKIPLTGRETYMDFNLEPLRTYEHMSVVLHCCNSKNCGPRVACGNFKMQGWR